MNSQYETVSHHQQIPNSYTYSEGTSLYSTFYYDDDEKKYKIYIQ